MPDPTIITSALSGPFTEGGITVEVQVYRLQDTKWSLEFVNGKCTSRVGRPLRHGRSRQGRVPPDRCRRGA